MDAITARHRNCAIVATRRTTPAGHAILFLALSGVGTSVDVSECLSVLADAGLFSSTTMAIVDTRAIALETEARGLFLQAEVLSRVRVRSVIACYLSEGEVTEAASKLLADVYVLAGISATIGNRHTLDEALAWIDEHVLEAG